MTSDRGWPKLVSSVNRFGATTRHIMPNFDGGHRLPHSSDGIPPSAVVSEEEGQRVDVGRTFPIRGRGARRTDIEQDHSKILVLSTVEDTRTDALRCGEALSTVLLECTMAGMATCTLTHMTEVEASREIVRGLTEKAAIPQVLLRVGTAPELDSFPPATPRRALADVLEFR